MVVVGYLSQKKASLTGAVTSMKVEENLTTIPTGSAGNLLTGKMAGVNVGTTSSIPGEILVFLFVPYHLGKVMLSLLLML